MKPKIRAYTYNYFRWVGELAVIPKRMLTSHIMGDFEFRIGDNIRWPISGLIIASDDYCFHIATMKSLN
jgi:hypothetical protein